MDSQLQVQLDRIDRALSQLTRSINSYNPSTEAAKELIAANSALDKGIVDLATHQRNHERIQALRSESTALDVQLTDRLRSLVDLREAIKTAPLHAPSNTSRSISASDVINHGIAISKYQAPHGYKAPSVLRQEAAGGTSGAQTQQTTAAASPEGSASPVKQPITAAGSPEPDTPAVGQSAPEGENATAGQETDPNANRIWINPQTQMPFIPWVTEDLMNRSGMRDKEYSDLSLDDMLAKLRGQGGGLETVAAPVADEAASRQQTQEAKPAVFSNWDDD